ncbi:hypothetical protein HOY80DRAFT_547356 [Tuber brumale]|nr:hypothetical protein HOY80DRAFT_547356 [Tuber brumale]
MEDRLPPKTSSFILSLLVLYLETMFRGLFKLNLFLFFEYQFLFYYTVFVYFSIPWAV